MTRMTVFGVGEIREVLEKIAPRHARNLINATLRGVTAEIRNKAKAKVVRDTGALKRSMFVYKPKTPPNLPQFQVKFRKQGFHWRFVEYGTGGGRGSHIPFLTGNRDAPVYGGAQPFLMPAVHEVRATLEGTIKQQFAVKLEQAVQREIKRQARARS